MPIIRVTVGVAVLLVQAGLDALQHAGEVVEFAAQVIAGDRFADDGYDLVLSGHTHGGQIAQVGWLYRLTGFGEWNYGRTSIDGLTVIVTSGMGGLNYPIRTGKHSEYVLVDILPA